MTTARTSRTRGSRCGSTRGLAAYPEGGPGRSSSTTRCGWPPRGPARVSSTGKASTSTASTRYTRESLALVRVANPSGPGWADPETGSFVDPRPKGRDGRPYGPLPRRWAHYRGLYHNGNRVILSYTVGTTRRARSPGLETPRTMPIFTRSFEIGPRERELVLQVAHLAGTRPPLRNVKAGDSGEVVLFGSEDGGAAPAAPALIFDGGTRVEVDRPDDFDDVSPRLLDHRPDQDQAQGERFSPRRNQAASGFRTARPGLCGTAGWFSTSAGWVPSRRAGESTMTVGMTWR